MVVAMVGVVREAVESRVAAVLMAAAARGQLAVMRVWAAAMQVEVARGWVAVETVKEAGRRVEWAAKLEARDTQARVGAARAAAG